MRHLFDDQERMYSLLEDQGALVLDVVVGTVALYTVRRRLSAEETARYRAEGKGYLDDLALEVVRQPSRWAARP